MYHPPIIAIVGAPRTGKSFLARRLAEHMGASLFLEDNGVGYPERMQENLAKNIRPLERQLWFRTTCVARHLEAKVLQQQGVPSVLDIFWLTTHMYIDVLLDGFERELMHTLLKQDELLVGYPDLIIYLKQSESGMRTFVSAGGRKFDVTETYYEEIIRPSHELHEQFFAQAQIPVPVLTIDRTNIDFTDPEAFTSFYANISELIQQ